MTRFALMTAALVLSAGAASAQSLVADIDFAFQAGGTTFAPGKYRVERMMPLSGVPMFRVMSTETRESIAIRGIDKIQRAGKTTAELVFRCFNGGCDLAEVRPVEGIGAEFPMSKRLKEASQMASIRVPAR